ncbi:unnamed protein product [Cercopithifilaria johnstoni]|uniref:Uncharacterized protein n=1 Tax=Cercopithifilaria johnstoni TaxID=2874296 RepID=A0A8J2LX01_9BILA|nr:unnamed protein product [Cercopithifilaria johnstoni]
MPIHALTCRIVAIRLGGIVPSTSGGVILNFLSTAGWKNFGNQRNFSNDTQLSIATELQALPIVQWFDRSMKTSRSYAQNLIESSGLSSTPLEHLGLYTWWKPSSWYRVFLEFLHINYELSWIATVICGIQSQVGSIMLYSSSAGIFLTQYCCIKKMAEVVYPSWTTSGILSFTDLTVPDPAFLLPTLTAICFTFTSKKWIETLQMQKTVSNLMIGLKPNNAIYPIAACSFFVANNVPSVVCIYWITSSLISSLHATLLRTGAVRSLLYLPGVCSNPAEARRNELLNYVSEMRRRRANETLEARKRIVEIGKKTQEDEISKPLIKEAGNIEKDSLFQDSWREGGAFSSSKIAKLMEQRIQEAARANVVTKSTKSNSITRADPQKFEIDEITAG